MKKSIFSVGPTGRENVMLPPVLLDMSSKVILSPSMQRRLEEAMPSSCSAEEPVLGRSILWCLTPARATLPRKTPATPRLVIELLLRLMAEVLILACSARVVTTVKSDSPTASMTPFLHRQQEQH